MAFQLDNIQKGNKSNKKSFDIDAVLKKEITLLVVLFQIKRRKLFT